jgi:hypothetical protein
MPISGTSSTPSSSSALLDRAHLALAAIDQHEIGPGFPFPPPLRSRSGSCVLSRERRPNRRSITSRIIAKSSLVCACLDVPLAILVLDEAFRPGDDHRAQRVGALNMAVVVDFDPLRRFGSSNSSAISRSNLPCVPLSASRRSSASSALRIACFDETDAVPALRARDAPPCPPPLRQRLFEQARLRANRGRAGSSARGGTSS